MHPRALTPIELADLLDAAYRQDRGLGGEGLALPERVDLAGFLGCHPDVQEEVWAAWQERMAENSDAWERVMRATGWMWSSLSPAQSTPNPFAISMGFAFVKLSNLKNEST
ncbi:hypothetical protein ACFFLM_19065 [Deinococcus oregonensis]|uniref:Uncharacterized protein n=1 Tax=Deinococcus oregonensis TaxID=1805970 RepID=A0ABV6B2R7_9DEIO